MLTALKPYVCFCVFYSSNKDDVLHWMMVGGVGGVY